MKLFFSALVLLASIPTLAETAKFGVECTSRPMDRHHAITRDIFVQTLPGNEFLEIVDGGSRTALPVASSSTEFGHKFILCTEHPHTDEVVSTRLSISEHHSAEGYASLLEVTTRNIEADQGVIHAKQVKYFLNCKYR